MIPAIAVVGHPNKGKSSIVATLADRPDVRIAPMPGTTFQADVYSVLAQGRELYRLIDTPGFQRSGEVLTWLKAHARDASTRAEVVREFVQQHNDDPRFSDFTGIRFWSWRTLTVPDDGSARKAGAI